MKRTRIALVALAVVGCAMLTGGTPREAQCATCVPAACYDSSTCAGTGCVCLRSGIELGQCMSVD